MRIQNYRSTDWAFQAGDAPEVRGHGIDMRFALDELNIVYAADGWV
jgi:hypothetical protein